MMNDSEKVLVVEREMRLEARGALIVTVRGHICISDLVTLHALHLRL